MCFCEQAVVAVGKRFLAFFFEQNLKNKLKNTFR